MINTYQTKQGLGRGNCFAACVASILEMHIEDVPNIETLYECSKGEHGELWVEVLTVWLAEKGWQWRPCPEATGFHINPERPSGGLLADGTRQSGGLIAVTGSSQYAVEKMWGTPYIAIGQMNEDSKEEHACIYMNGDILWNPNPLMHNRPLKTIKMLQVLENTSIPYKDRVNKDEVCRLCTSCNVKLIDTENPPPLCEDALNSYLSLAIIG